MYTIFSLRFFSPTSLLFTLFFLPFHITHFSIHYLSHLFLYVFYFYIFFIKIIDMSSSYLFFFTFFTIFSLLSLIFTFIFLALHITQFFPFYLFDHLFLYLIIFLIKVINTYSFFSNAFFTSFTHFHFPFSCIPYHTLFFYLHLLSHLFLFVSLNYTFSSVTNMYSFFSYDFHFYFSYFSSLFLPSHPLPLSIDQLSVKRFLTSIPLSSSFSFVPHLIFPESISGGGKKIYSR